MGQRPASVWFGALGCAVCVALALLSLLAPPAHAIADPPTDGAWMRPVPGPLARPFVAPLSRYGAGHRGADLAAKPGTPVRAANGGEVSFAGNVAGTLHVVVAHAGGLRTSYSFLATVTVRRGQTVARGQVVGTAGATDGDHVGVLHLGLRSGERYLDPMLLFTPADLSTIIRLVPVDEPARAGLDPPVLERRSLAEALHRPGGQPGGDDEDGGAPGGIGAIVGGAFGEVTAVASFLAEPGRRALERLGEFQAWAWDGISRTPLVADAHAMAARIASWVRSRLDCSDAANPARGTGGSGHLALAVAGINSSTDPTTGSTMRLDTVRLGYHAGEVRSFSYAPSGGPYRARDTWGDLRLAAAALGEQLRAMQRAHPGLEVDLIGHSQGGVVVATFLATIYDASDPSFPPLGSVVTLSSPLRGAPAATAIGQVRSTASGRTVLDGVDGLAGGALPPTSGTATRQLAERSSTIRELTDATLPEQIDLTAIGATDDVIVPADHASGLGAQSTTVNPPGVSDHSAIVADPGALDAARHALEGRPLPCVGVADGVRGAVEPVVISRLEHLAGDLGEAAARATDRRLEQGGSR